MASLSKGLQYFNEDVHDLVERYDLLTSNLAAAVIIFRPEGDVVFCSPFSEVLTGYSIEEIYEGGSAFIDSIVINEDLERYERAKKISSIGEDIVVRYQIRHRSGISLWIETHFVPVCNEEGDVLSIMGVSMDVTASVRYQQKIEEQNRDLNDFSYMVSHDLKAPIFTIKGMASLLLEDYQEKLDEEGTESIQHIIDAGNRLEALIKSVIEYSSISTKNLENTEVSLENVLGDVIKDLKQQVSDSGSVIETPSDMPKVVGNESRMYQVFSNLISNAIKYRDQTRETKITISSNDSNAEFVEIKIKDNGLGIPSDKLEDIFRPYHRAHGADIEGSGIGLACVKKILDRSGGSISVESTEGSGSTFTVLLRHATPDAIIDTSSYSSGASVF